ncbi:MAG TPA: hypothetical protein VFD82_08590 [Planctomycetota bacterium]|nr:hypothetical protein [Planctomycetota bacterium]
MLAALLPLFGARALTTYAANSQSIWLRMVNTGHKHTVSIVW